MNRTQSIPLSGYISDRDPYELTFRVISSPPDWHVSVRTTPTVFDDEVRTLSYLAALPNVATSGVATVRATNGNGECTDFPVHLVTGVWRCCRRVSNVQGFLSCSCFLDSNQLSFENEWLHNVRSCRTWGTPGAEVFTATRVSSCGCENDHPDTWWTNSPGWRRNFLSYCEGSQ